LNILKINTKSTITNVEKALLTITKIDTLDLSVDELKETGWVSEYEYKFMYT
jgi:hypothetical protein